MDAGKVNLPFPADTTARGQRGTEGGGRPTNPREDSAKLVNEDKLVDQMERDKGSVERRRRRRGEDIARRRIKRVD